MNLQENYERFFGKIKPAEDRKEITLDEAQKTRFNNISNMLAKKYPNAPLTIREGYVYIGYKKFQLVEDFLKRTSLNIQETVRSISVSGKKGLI